MTISASTRCVSAGDVGSESSRTEDGVDAEASERCRLRDEGEWAYRSVLAAAEYDRG